MHKLLRDKPWYEPVGLIDISPAALAETGVAIGVPENRRFSSLKDALATVKPDAVFINTPAQLHHAQCIEAIKHGLHVMVAKPFTTDYEAALDLVNRADDRGVTISVGQQIRYQKHFLAVAHQVASGALGKVEAAWFKNAKPRPNPANLVKMPQPALIEMACHHFDAFFSVFPESIPESIFCDGWRPS